MTNVTIKEAALLVGKSRQSINEATRDGTLSYKLDGRQRKVVDIVELERVYPLVKTVDEIAESKNVKVTPKLTSDEPPTLREELAIANERLARAEAERESLERERERERLQLERQIENLQATVEKSQEQHSKAMLLITDQSEKSRSRADIQREESEKLGESVNRLALQNKRLYKELKALKEKGFWERLFG